jgi:multicomponent Na+:H+ antiporter subunit D
MIFNNHLILLPILIPLVGAAVALLLRPQKNLVGGWSFGTMLTSLLAASLLLWQVWQSGTPLVFASGGWQAPFGIVLVADLLAVFMVLMSQLVISMGMLYALGCNDKCVTYPGFFPAFLLLAVGLTGGMLTGDLFNLFVFVELLVIAGTILTAVSDDKYGTEAAYKYFYISLLAAAFLLLACATLYISYGTLNMADLAQRIGDDTAQGITQPLLPIAVALLTAFFMVKSAVFPFHFWQPDFHTAAPTPVHAVLSSVVVKLGIYGFLRLNNLLFIEFAPTIQMILLVTGVIGVFYGGLGAMGTYDAKRMLAYSTMGQLGFILVGVGWGTPLAITAVLVFAFNHSLAKAAMLMLAGAIASRAPVKSAAFSVIQGVGQSTPLTGILFLLGALALAGIPPTNGFVSKALLFNSGMAFTPAGWLNYLPLALLGFGGLITVVYTMRAFQRIWWQSMEKGAKAKESGDKLFAPLLLITAVLLLGIYAEPLVALADATTLWLGQPEAYIFAVLPQ